MSVEPVVIKMEGTEYVGYYFGKNITRGKSLRKVSEKIFKYIKGLGNE